MSKMLNVVEEIRKKFMFRMDADGDNENENENEKAGKGGGKRFTGLATRLPYGIAKDMGIDTTGMTPREVWDKIEGKGVSPKAAMSEKLASPDKRVSVSTAKAPKKLPKATMDSFPDAFSKPGVTRKETERFCEKLNSAEGTDSVAGELYRGMKTLRDKCPFDAIKNAEKKACPPGKGVLRVTYGYSSGEIKNCEVHVPKIKHEGNAVTAAHEMAHYMDALCGDGNGLTGYMASEKDKGLTDAINAERVSDKTGLKEERWAELSDASKRIKKAKSEVTSECSKQRSQILRDYYDRKISRDEYFKQRRKINADEKDRRSAVGWAESDGYDTLIDMYDAMSGGEFFENGLGIGHGRKYYSEKGNKESELFANYCALSVFRPKLLKKFEEDFPKTAEALRKRVEWVQKRMGE